MVTGYHSTGESKRCGPQLQQGKFCLYVRVRVLWGGIQESTFVVKEERLVERNRRRRRGMSSYIKCVLEQEHLS